MNKTLITLLIIALSFVNASSSEVDCKLCKIITDRILDKVDSNSTIESIENKVVKICDHIPEKYYDKCSNLVFDNIPKITDNIFNRMSSDKICFELHQCSSKYDLASTSSKSKMNFTQFTDS